MRILLIILGSVALVLGVVGIFLPLLPTTPFLLLAAALYFRSSPQLYDWLLSHPHLGHYIKNFREHKAIPLRVKIVSVSLVWITLLYCAFYVARVWWLRLFFILLACGISAHILHYKTLRKESDEK
ncbi:MAG: YbaN family protein [Bacteroidaceae bacterium]|nr:YbaN family protein [Bacteroidaceae bacterium]